MSLSEMEDISCKNNCDGIFKHPREVHLLGCNTLASKQSNSIRAEFPTYSRDLRAQGYNENALQEYFHDLFSPIGLSMETRFSLVFPNTPRILGYSGIGPTGPQIESEFKDYASQSKYYYQNLYKKPRSSLLEPHFEYLRILSKRSPLKQNHGDSFYQNSFKNAFCQMSDDNISKETQIETLIHTLKVNPLERVTLIHKWWKNIENKYSSIVQSRLLKQVLTANKSYLSLFYQDYFKRTRNLHDSIIIGELLYLSGEMPYSEYKDTVQNRLIQYDSRHSLQATSIICSAGKNSLNPKKSVHHLIDINLIDTFAIEVLKCIPSSNEIILFALLKSFKNFSKLQDMRDLAYTLFLQNWQNTQFQKIQFNDVWNLYLEHDDIEIKRYLIKLLAKWPSPLTEDEKNIVQSERNQNESVILKYELRLLIENNH